MEFLENATLVHKDNRLKVDKGEDGSKHGQKCREVLKEIEKPKDGKLLFLFTKRNETYAINMYMKLKRYYDCVDINATITNEDIQQADIVIPLLSNFSSSQVDADERKHYLLISHSLECCKIIIPILIQQLNHVNSITERLKNLIQFNYECVISSELELVKHIYIMFKKEYGDVEVKFKMDPIELKNLVESLLK